MADPDSSTEETGPPPGGEERLVADLQAAHRATEDYAKLLAEARQRRRDLAVQLRDFGRSYRWIGAQIGVTAQAVEGFVKYHQRHQSRRLK